LSNSSLKEAIASLKEAIASVQDAVSSTTHGKRKTKGTVSKKMSKERGIYDINDGKFPMSLSIKATKP